MVRQVRPDEALVPRARRDLPDALQLGQVQPLVRRPSLVRVGEERRSLHLGGRQEEENRLLLVARLAAIVELELPDPLAAPAADPERQLLVAVVPVTGGVVERLSPVEDLTRGLFRGDGATHGERRR